jgi:hypothetical protein
MESKSLLVKNNSSLRNHRRTKSSFDYEFNNDSPKNSQLDRMAITLDKFTSEKLSNSSNAYFSHQNKETFPSTDQTTKILKESYQKNNKTKEIYVEKLELSNEEMNISPTKNSSNYLFEFGKKKINNLIKTLETSKSSNFEDRLNSLKHKYEISDQDEHIFIIPEQHNEIEDGNPKREIKEAFNLKFLHNKMKSLMTKPASANPTNEKDETIKNFYFKEQPIEAGPRRDNKCESNLIKNFSLLINKGLIIKNKEANKKSLENIENRMNELEKEIESLKFENKKLKEDNKVLAQKMETILSAKKLETLELEFRINELEAYIEKNKDNFEKIRSLLRINLDDSGLLNKTELKEPKIERRSDLSTKNELINKNEMNSKTAAKESERNARKSIIETTINKKETTLGKQIKKAESKYTKSMSHFFEKNNFMLDSDNSSSTKNSNINQSSQQNGAKKIFFTPKGVNSFFFFDFICFIFIYLE